MEPRRLKLVARLVLVAFAAGCALWLARLDYAKKISTNVLDLIPATERSPEIGLVRSFANAAQARVVVLLHRGEEGVEIDEQTAQRHRKRPGTGMQYRTAASPRPARISRFH